MENSFETYQNSTYKNERTKKQSLTIQIPADASNFKKIDLHEPLRIDSLTDIYLDSVITAPGTKDGTKADQYVFVLKVSEFDITSNSGSTGDATRGKMFNSIIIPNTRGNDTDTVTHRINKFNFVSTLNPTVLTSLNVQFGTLHTDGSEITKSNGVTWITFMFVSRD